MTAPVFVFGSNLVGKHGGGAARHAFDNCGAEWGVGEGLTGDSYALPTMDAAFNPLPFPAIEQNVGRFIDVAHAHPEIQFQVTAIGCGIAGFVPEQIAPFFRDAPDNCQMPPEFTAALIGEQ